MSDERLKDFLDGLGLAAHLEAFLAEEITFDDLSYLSVTLMVFMSWTDIVTLAQIIEFDSCLFFAIGNRWR